ncbi:MAG: threonine-phosphate decarboxylase CobD [Clostridium sp.]
MNYGHGGNIDEISRVYGINKDEIIDFSANINPLGLNKSVEESIIKGICNVDRYPDITYRELRDSIARYENTNSENILLGNGAGEVIFNIVRAIMPRVGLVMAPSFSEYEDALNSVGARVNHYTLSKDFNIESDFLDEISCGVNMVFLCNPNNPTGVLTPRNIVEAIAKKCEGVGATLVVDESFLDFVEDKDDYSMISLVNRFKNMIVVKSLTKFFAFPGIRIGYGITSSTSYISGYRGACPPWNVNTLAMVASITAMDQDEYSRESVNYIKGESQRLYNELNSINHISAYKPSVNYVLLKCSQSIDLQLSLIKKGILIRDCSNYKGLEKGYYRVAVKKVAENNRLINALKEVLG